MYTGWTEEGGAEVLAAQDVMSWHSTAHIQHGTADGAGSTA